MSDRKCLYIFFFKIKSRKNNYSKPTLYITSRFDIPDCQYGCNELLNFFIHRNLTSAILLEKIRVCRTVLSDSQYPS